MPTYNVTVKWQYVAADYTTIEVEAKNEKKAKALALEKAQNDPDGTVEWDDGDITDGEYMIYSCEEV